MDEQGCEILALSNYIAAQQRTLTLITNFRGVPIHLTAGIIRCSKTTGIVRLRVRQRQIVSLNTLDQILVQSELFRQMVVCDIEQVDLDTATVSLKNLRYAAGSMGNRKNMRVQPESPIHSEVILGHGYNVPGEVIDISLDGLSLCVAKDYLPQNDTFMLEAPVEIRLGLPINSPVLEKGSIHDLRMRATIAYTTEHEKTYRIGLRTFLKAPGLQLVRRYLFDRQTEILHEIQQMNSAMLSAHSPEINGGEQG